MYIYLITDSLSFYSYESFQDRHLLGLYLFGLKMSSYSDPWSGISTWDMTGL